MRGWLAIAILACGCSSKLTGGDDDTVEPDPKGWTITVDMTSDRFVQPAAAMTWDIAGKATGTAGIQSVTVNDHLVDLAGDGTFSSTVSVTPGLSKVRVLATDTDGHTRKGDHALIATRLLPDGTYNDTAASLVLTSSVLAAALSRSSFRLPHFGLWTQDGHPALHGQRARRTAVSATHSAKQANPRSVMPTPPACPS